MISGREGETFRAFFHVRSVRRLGMSLAVVHGGTMTKAEYEVEPLGETTGICECCGAARRAIWGVVHAAGAETVASYFVTWVPGVGLAAHAAHMDLIVGAWGEGTGASDRVAVSLQYGHSAEGAELRVIGSADRKIAKNPLVGVALGPDDVMGSPLATTAFGVFDAVMAQDARFSG